jgi:hypothetical protein
MKTINRPASIKQLIIDETKKLKKGESPIKEHLEKLVAKYFPESKWKDTHYAWYKSQIKRGIILIDESDFLGKEVPTADNNNEFSLLLERDLLSYLSLRLDQIENGLELIENGIEYHTSAGDIDILAKDIYGNLVVIELKAGKAKDSAIGQILGYMGALSESKNGVSIRGINVASDFEPRLYFASKSLENLQLVKYNLIFSFSSASVL